MPRRKTTRRRRLDKVMDYNPGNSFRIIDNKTIEDFNMPTMAIWVVEFSTGGTKLERFLPKNHHTQRKLLNFENEEV